MVINESEKLGSGRYFFNCSVFRSIYMQRISVWLTGWPFIRCSFNRYVKKKDADLYISGHAFDGDKFITRHFMFINRWKISLALSSVFSIHGFFRLLPFRLLAIYFIMNIHICLFRFDLTGPEIIYILSWDKVRIINFLLAMINFLFLKSCFEDKYEKYSDDACCSSYIHCKHNNADQTISSLSLFASVYHANISCFQ